MVAPAGDAARLSTLRETGTRTARLAEAGERALRKRAHCLQGAYTEANAPSTILPSH